MVPFLFIQRIVTRKTTNNTYCYLYKSYILI